MLSIDVVLFLGALGLAIGYFIGSFVSYKELFKEYSRGVQDTMEGLKIAIEEIEKEREVAEQLSQNKETEEKQK